MQIVLAHSNKNYVKDLESFFINEGIFDIYIFHEGFAALTHIIKNRSNIIIIEEELPGLNVKDIKKAFLYKHIKPVLMIHISKRVSPKQMLAKIKSEFTLDKSFF